ncbi:hypothetical protein ACJJTC_014989 [Scirpophaga incertulas]
MQKPIFFKARPVVEGRDELLECEDRAAYVNFLKEGDMPVTLADLRRETACDPVLTTVKDYVLKGWPRKINEIELKPYFNCRSQLSYENDLLSPPIDTGRGNWDPDTVPDVSPPQDSAASGTADSGVAAQPPQGKVPTGGRCARKRAKSHQRRRCQYQLEGRKAISPIFSTPTSSDNNEIYKLMLFQAKGENCYVCG